MNRSAKNIFASLLLLAGICPLLSKAQFNEATYQYSGKVKTLTLTEIDSRNNAKARFARSFDTQGRLIKEVDVNRIQKEYYYKNAAAKKPALIYRYDPKQPARKVYTIKEYSKDEQLELSNANIVNGKFEDLDYLTHLPDRTDQYFFKNGTEFYAHSRKDIKDLKKENFPKNVVPFTWDRTTSRWTEEKLLLKDETVKSIKFKAKFIEKDQSGNWVEFEYMASAADKSATGTLDNYKNGRLAESREIHNLESIPDKAYQFIYNKEGKLLTKTYGYFDKLPKGDLIQQTTYTYNSKGDLKSQESITSAKTDYLVKYNYQYDGHNNWTSCDDQYEDGAATTYKRNFTYYKENEPAVKNSLTSELYSTLHTQLEKELAVAFKNHSKIFMASAEYHKPVEPGLDYDNFQSTRWQDFYPAGSKLDTVAYGDLNKDGIKDMVIVYQPVKNDIEPALRTLRILFKNARGLYKLAAESHAVQSANNSDLKNSNPVVFDGIRILSGILQIKHRFLIGESSHKYRYQNGGFYLIGIMSITGDDEYTKQIDYNLSTGQYVINGIRFNEVLNRSISKMISQGVKKISPLPNINTYKLYSLEVSGFHL